MLLHSQHFGIVTRLSHVTTIPLEKLFKANSKTMQLGLIVYIISQSLAEFSFIKSQSTPKSIVVIMYTSIHLCSPCWLCATFCIGWCASWQNYSWLCLKLDDCKSARPQTTCHTCLKWLVYNSTRCEIYNKMTLPMLRASIYWLVLCLTTSCIVELLMCAHKSCYYFVHATHALFSNETKSCWQSEDYKQTLVSSVISPIKSLHLSWIHQPSY